jgi:uncharacterized phiE125 gp8 family phage protein
MTIFSFTPSSLVVSPQRYEVTTAAASDPLTLDDAKNFARIDGSDDDSTVRRLIGSATEYLESITGRRFVNTTLTAYFDAFPESDDDWLELRVPPVSSITTVKYINAEDGVLTVMDAADYHVDSKSNNQPARITPAFSASWPAERDILNAVEVEFVTGYGSSHTSVPDNIKHVIALFVSHWYTHRDLTGTSMGINGPMKALVDKMRWDSP